MTAKVDEQGRKLCPECGRPWVYQYGSWEFSCGSYFDGSDASFPFVRGKDCKPETKE